MKAWPESLRVRIEEAFTNILSDLTQLIETFFFNLKRITCSLQQLVNELHVKNVDPHGPLGTQV